MCEGKDMKKISFEKIQNSLREIFLTRIGKIYHNITKTIVPNDELDNFDGGGLNRYTEDDYVAINSFLWQKEEFFNGIRGLERIVKDIIEITENMELTSTHREHVVYRGTSLHHYPELLDIKKGMKLPLKSLTSTSLDYTTAEMFADMSSLEHTPKNYSPLIFKITFGDNTPFSRPNTEGTLYEIEEEVVLPPCEYEVVDVHPQGNRKYSALEVEMKFKQPLNVQQLIIDGLDHILQDDPLDTHNIYPEDIVNLKRKVNNYYKRKKSEKIRECINREIEDNSMEK